MNFLKLINVKPRLKHLEVGSLDLPSWSPEMWYCVLICMVYFVILSQNIYGLLLLRFSSVIVRHIIVSCSALDHSRSLSIVDIIIDHPVSVSHAIQRSVESPCKTRGGLPHLLPSFSVETLVQVGYGKFLCQKSFACTSFRVPVDLKSK